LFYRADLAEGRTSPHIAVRDGLDPAIDEIAAAGAPERAFLSRSWFAAAIPPDARARTIVMRRDGGEAVIALPVAPGRFGINAVPGSYWPYRSFPVAATLTVSEFETFLAAPAVKRALGHVWRIGPIYSDDPALHLIERAAGVAGWRLLKRRMGTSFQVDFGAVEAEGPWPRKTTLRRNRQLENQMARIGALEWLSLSGGQLDSDLLDVLAGLEAASWHGKSRDAKFLSPVHRRLWDGLIADPDQAQRLRVNLLTIDGKPAVMLFQLEAGAMIHGIATSYDPAFATHSPGKCLHMRALVAARAQGVKHFDWGAGDSGYKQQLSAKAGAGIVDCLLIRGPLAAILQPVLERLWRRHESADAVVAQAGGVALDGID
jgi:CelD/BcsL family acetyltransferase involved in cellulose biosynthesis